jgi:hypothetical protein
MSIQRLEVTASGLLFYPETPAMGNNRGFVRLVAIVSEAGSGRIKTRTKENEKANIIYGQKPGSI